MKPFRVVEGRRHSRIVLTCEHSSNRVPAEYGTLGLERERLDEHIAWDIGAAELAAYLATALAAPLVLAGVTRLVVDCNRGIEDADLVACESDGVVVPGNERVDATERRARIERFYDPYHQAADQLVGDHPGALVFSIHSFTPSLRSTSGQSREFDVGVLYDSFARDAERLGRGLARGGLQVRYNEPYSGFAGLIFSARYHGLRHRRRYLELEVNNVLLRSSSSIRSIGDRVATALENVLEEQCESS